MGSYQLDYAMSSKLQGSRSIVFTMRLILFALCLLIYYLCVHVYNMGGVNGACYDTCVDIRG